MSEQSVIAQTAMPITEQSLIQDLRSLGVQEGHCVLVHSSMRRIGWISGGAQAVIGALLRVLGERGTLIMPAHSTQNTDPANWSHPPVPKAWWPIIRQQRPAYDPAVTPTRAMGRIAELFRTYPGVKRSAHPIGSFAAIGHHADHILAKHTSLEQMFGNASPIGKLYDVDGYVLLLGVTHSNNTSLHLAEYRADFSSKKFVKEGTAMIIDGKREWLSFTMQSLDDEDFSQLGEAYHQQHGKMQAKVGLADAILVRSRPLVDFAVRWLEQHRT